MRMCRDFLVVCGWRFWLFGVSRLGGDAPLAELAPKGVRLGLRNSRYVSRLQLRLEVCAT